MHRIAAAALISVTLAAPAFAGQKEPSTGGGHQLQAQGQVQGQAQGQAQKSNSRSNANANSNSDANSSVGGDDVNAWGFSYVDSSPQVPQGVIAEQMMITSQNLKVLGPIFGYAWQSTTPTPAGLVSFASLLQAASTNDQTDVGRSAQSSVLATICTFKPELADARFGSGACDRIGEIVSSTK